eukprot:CAMPEP_0181138886 /NCGR_PEP_ID=MMETSP1071-20121207/34486_1 /TAXON_ID=35127 /ORGANISM="Thalassiosira sp., Strain NH16" /LENGTH=433 /DNA_ID=CAMNT_0023225753 /DNA_START=113 /DNA_END=1414 /DNA_ORIENTATION=-
MASTSNHLNNKRRRKSSDHHHHQRQRREGHNKKYNAAAAEEVAADQSPVLSTTTTSPRRTSSSTTNNNRPSWVPTKYDFPWSSHAATYGNCPNVSSRYEKIGRIGEGTYGVVYQARDRQTGDIVALKRCLPHHEASDGFPLTTLREITVLRELQSAGGRRHGIIGLKDVTVSSSVFLVFEYAQHDLATLVDEHYTQHRRSPFSHGDVKRLVLQLLGSLRFMHSRCVLHRDLKLSNLLYNHRGELRWGGYVGYNGDDKQSRVGGGDNSEGSSCLTPKVVSLWYRPPELLFGSEHYDRGVDNWGAGCVMGELLRGKPLMDGRDEMDQLQKMFDFLGPPSTDDWPGLKDLPLLKSGTIEIPKRWHMQRNNDGGRHVLDIFRDWKDPRGLELLTGLLKYDPDARWTADEALAADYFRTMPAPTPLSLMPTFPTKHNK